MPQMVEGPDLDEKERKEELESVSAGDMIGSGMAFKDGRNPVTATSDEDYVAALHRSGTRTESSACGDSSCSPKTTCSGMSEEKAPEQEAEKKAVQSQKDEDKGQRSACTRIEDLNLDKAGKPVPAVDEGDVYIHAEGTETGTELSPAAACSGMSEEKAPEQEAEDNVQQSTLKLRTDLKLVKAGKPVPLAGKGDDDEHAQGTETCAEPSPATATSIMEGERLAAVHEGNHDLHGKSRSTTKRRKLPPGCAPNRTTAERHKLVLAVLFSLTWTAVMGSEEVKMATVSCSLSAAIPFIIVKHFGNDSSAVMVMYCGENYNPACHSNYNCSMENWDDQVVSFKCPEAMLKRGTFKLQSQENGHFIPCPNSTVDNSTDTGAGQNPHTALIVGMSVVVVIIIIVAIIIYKRCYNRPGEDGCMKVKWCPWNWSKKEPVSPEGQPMNGTSV